MEKLKKHVMIYQNNGSDEIPVFTAVDGRNLKGRFKTNCIVRPKELKKDTISHFLIKRLQKAKQRRQAILF